MSEFKKWFNKYYSWDNPDRSNSHPEGDCEAAWRHQQKKIDELEKLAQDRFDEMGRLQDLNLKGMIANQNQMKLLKNHEATISEMSEVIKFYGDKDNNYTLDGIVFTVTQVGDDDFEQDQDFGNTARQLISKHPEIFGEGE